MTGNTGWAISAQTRQDDRFDRNGPDRLSPTRPRDSDTSPGNPAIVQSPMRSLIPFPSRRRDCEWIGGRYEIPNKVREGGSSFYPEVILWMELPRGVILSSKISHPGEPISITEALLEAMEQPIEGSSRKPSQIRVADGNLAEELRGVVDVTVVVAPVPELDEAFSELIETLAGAGPLAMVQSYLAGGNSPAVVARLFSAAGSLFRAAPWRDVSEDQLVRVDIPSLAVDGVCLSVIGGAGESFGLLLFQSLEAYEALAAAPPAPASEEELLAARPNRETSLLSLSFDRKRDIPAPMLKEISHYRWPVAATKAYPTLMAVDKNAIPKPPTEREFRIVTACATAFLEFLAVHLDLFDEEDPETICESFTAGDGLTVTLTAPYGTTGTSIEVEDFFAPDEDEIIEIAPPKRTVGRNDPCPCGSGKKYKKCHLDTDRPRSEGSTGTAAVHEMDFRLVQAIGKFGSSRFGPSWVGPSAKNFDADQSSLQLFLPWAAWTATVGGKRIADSFFEEQKGRLSDEEREWFDAQRRAWLSVWEVTRVEPGMIDVRDLLTGEIRSVREVAASRSVVARDALLTRVIDFRGDSLLGGMFGHTLTPEDASEVIGTFRSKLHVSKGNVPVERLRDPEIGRFMIDGWHEAVQERIRRASIPPLLQNTDGDLLLLVTDSFPFAMSVRSEIERRLTEMDGTDDVQTANGETTLVFVRLGNPIHKSWENTVIGRAIVGPNTLRIETNSERRADALKRRVRDACGKHLRRSTRTTTEPSTLPRAPKQRAAPDRELTPNEHNLLRAAKEAHYRDWVDTPLPALGGKTPRAAARSAKSRDRLDLLLRQMENQENRLPAATRFDAGQLRRELGMD